MNLICCNFQKTTSYHGIIESSIKTSQQNNWAWLDCNLYLNLPCQNSIWEKTFTNQMYNNHSFYWLF